MAPDDWEGFKGQWTEVVLRWEWDGTLASDEWFLIETETGPNFEFPAEHYVRTKRFQLPTIHGNVEYWTTFGQVTRWKVTVVRGKGAQKQRLSPSSPSRHLVWTEVG